MRSDSYYENRKIIITRKQHETLLGLILGDVHLERSPNQKSTRLRIAQSYTKHPWYVDHLLGVFITWGIDKNQPNLRNPRPREDKSVILELDSIFTPSLLPYRQLFYLENGKKRILAFKKGEFTARSFAYLYMDDGGLKSKQSKGCFINTYRDFTKDEQEIFCKYLLKYLGLQAKVGEDRGAPRIFISGDSLDTLLFLLNGRVLPEFQSKIPSPRTGKGIWRTNVVPEEFQAEHSLEQDEKNADEPINLVDLDLFKRYVD